MKIKLSIILLKLTFKINSLNHIFKYRPTDIQIYKYSKDLLLLQQNVLDLNNGFHQIQMALSWFR